MLQSRLYAMEPWILHVVLAESLRGQHTCITLATSSPVGKRIVARGCQRVIDSQAKSRADDLCFRHADQRCLNAQLLFRFHRRLRCEVRHALKCFDEFWPAIWVPAVIKGIHADEDVIRAKYFRPRQREREKHRVAGW